MGEWVSGRVGEWMGRRQRVAGGRGMGWVRGRYGTGWALTHNVPMPPSSSVGTVAVGSFARAELCAALSGGLLAATAHAGAPNIL